LVGSLSALVAAGSLVRIGGAQEEEKEKGKEMIEVRQGGYVEQVDPNVDYKDRLPRILPKEPAESMKHFHLLPGFRLDQVATEPLIADPVDLVFDENGRLYVAELITYAEGQQNGGVVTHTSRVSLLEDTDGDGRFDKTTVFADGLSWPTGLVPFDGGLFVATTPEVIYFKDTDGDNVANQSEVVISGFTPSNPNACPNSLRWGLDSRIHGMASTSGGKLRAEKWAKSPEGKDTTAIESRGRDFSFDPRTGQMRLESGGSQFGMTLDAWGRKFESSNSVPIEMVMFDEHYIARNPYLAAPSSRLRIYADGSSIYRTSPVEPWRVLRTELRIKKTFSGPVEGGGTPAGYFTGACGVHIYQGNALPEELRGNAFVCEGSGNLIHRMRLESEAVAFTAHRIEEKKEFLTSDEIWFRPIQFTDGPDGALYLADMYRELYEHPDAIPPSARKYLDLLAGNDRGRIYRIVPEGFQQPPPVRLGGLSTEKLVGLLEHANGWHRNTASRLLYERHDLRAVEPLVKLAAESDSPLGRMHAMWMLAGLDRLTPEVVLARLADDHPRVRDHAVRLAERVLADSPAVRAKLYEMVDDEDARVRYQLAFTLGEISGSQATDALARVARRDAADRWVRLAVLSSAGGRAGELFSRLAEDAAWRATSDGQSFLEQIAEQAGLQKRDDQVAEVFKALETFGEAEEKLAQAVVRGLSKGLSKSGSPLLSKLKSNEGGRAGLLLGEMIEAAKQRAADAEVPVDRRVQAVRSLAMASLEESGDVLGKLLDSRQPQEVQKAALQALGRFQDDRVAQLIVEAWGGFSPLVRGEAAEALFARPDRVLVLLKAVEEGRILPSQLDPARIQFVLSHPDEKIRRAAEAVLGGVRFARREEVVEAWRDALDLKGDSKNGKVVFQRECSKCHLLEGVGTELGLPLDTVKNKGPEAILQSVLDPNREVLPQYLNYVVVTDEGLSITGMIESETANSITLKRAEGETDVVLRGNIEELVNTGLSIMPEGNEKLVTKQELADIVAYLMSLQ
jgi:putative membrane-bound dehydrogenase-like protein